MTFLALINNWTEFERVAPFLVIGFLVWKFIEWIKFDRTKSKLEKRLNDECEKLKKEVLSKYSEAEIEKVRICMTLIWKLRNERTSWMKWSERQRMKDSIGFEHWHSVNLRLLEQQMIIDGKEEGTIDCAECHVKDTIDFWEKLETDKSEFSKPDFAWQMNKIRTWNSYKSQME
jgi:hypothetical protein